MGRDEGPACGQAAPVSHRRSSLCTCFSLSVLEFKILRVQLHAQRTNTFCLKLEIESGAISMQPYKELTGNAERQIMELRQRARGDPRRRSIYYNWANDVLTRWMNSASAYANTEDDLRNLRDLIDRFP